MSEENSSGPDVIVGTPICRRTSFALDKFLSNQQEIQQAYPGCLLVLATDEPNFATELKGQIDLYQLQGEVITYETVKPEYAQSNVWSIACGREVLRQYTLSKEIEDLLFLDSDMVYEPSVISIMKNKSHGFDVVSSGYRLPHWGGWGFGAGCLLINRKALKKITFRCNEFKNGEVICEDELLDMDLFRCHARVNRGIFVSIKHYKNNQEYEAMKPQPVGWFRALTNNLLTRYLLIRLSIVTRQNIAQKLHNLLCKICKD